MFPNIPDMGELDAMARLLTLDYVRQMAATVTAAERLLREWSIADMLAAVNHVDRLMIAPRREFQRPEGQHDEKAIGAIDGGRRHDERPRIQVPRRRQRDDWRRVWKVVQEMWGEIDDWGNPLRLEDYADRVQQRMGWRPCTKTVSKILQAGRDGLLE